MVPGYIIERVISSRGGSAVIYFGRDISEWKPVAIKQLYPHMIRTLDLLREYEFYQCISHPNITRCLDFVVNQRGEGFLVMEYVKGMTLNEYQNHRVGLMPDDVAKPVIMQLLDAVGHIHKKNILHLDIKRNNIILDDNMKIKLLDFGISRWQNEFQTNWPAFGTLDYMSPEQLQGLNLDKYTDIYAIGVTLYFMLTGKSPFYGENAKMKKGNILNGNYISPKEHYPYINENWLPVLERALSWHYKYRYQSCEEMAYDIDKRINLKKRKHIF